MLKFTSIKVLLCQENNEVKNVVSNKCAVYSKQYKIFCDHLISFLHALGTPWNPTLWKVSIYMLLRLKRFQSLSWVIFICLITVCTFYIDLTIHVCSVCSNSAEGALFSVSFFYIPVANSKKLINLIWIDDLKCNKLKPPHPHLKSKQTNNSKTVYKIQRQVMKR